MSDEYEYFEEEEFSTEFNDRTLRRILAQTLPYRRWIASFLVMISIVAFLDAYFTFLSKRIVDEGIVAGNRAALTNIVTIYGALIVVQAGAVFTMIYLTGVLGERVRYDLRRRLFNHLQELSLSYYSRTPVGWIMSRVTSDTERVADLLTWGILDTTWAVMNIASSAFFMIQINWRLTLLVMLSVPLLVVVSVQFRRKILVEYRTVRKMNSKVTGAYNENITGVRVVKALGREPANMQEFGKLTGEMYRAGYRAAWLSALFLPTVQIISAFALGSIVWYGGLQATVGAMTIGGIQAFVSYVTFMMWPIQDIARVYAEMQQSIASAERMFSLIDAVPEVSDQPGAYDPGSMQGDIEFDHVDFFYEDGKPVLANFTLKVKQGETIALVGPTGAGKTSIISLIARFYDAGSGMVKIDGTDIRRYRQKSLRGQISFVLQDTLLFHAPVWKNIAYGKPEASRAEVLSAAEAANAHEFIVMLPEGYDTVVGERGETLSGGHRQRIAIARAIIRGTPILILDEPSSDLDAASEKLVFEALDRLMEGKTSIVIAHRLSTIRRADVIFVVQEGRIVERGKHEELLESCGLYAELYRIQFQKESDALEALDGVSLRKS